MPKYTKVAVIYNTEGPCVCVFLAAVHHPCSLHFIQEPVRTRFVKGGSFHVTKEGDFNAAHTSQGGSDAYKMASSFFFFLGGGGGGGGGGDPRVPPLCMEPCRVSYRETGESSPWLVTKW